WCIWRWCWSRASTCRLCWSAGSITSRRFWGKAMAQLELLLDGGTPVEAHRPCRRSVIGEAAWNAAAGQLAVGEVTLLGLWGEAGTIHMALGEGRGVGVLSLPCPDGHYPSVGRLHPPALRLERAARDLFGLVPDGSPDPRPWLRHDAPYDFLPAEGPGLH